jgi:tRNA G18 (ribose-2'-O)-methylase SpoU
LLGVLIKINFSSCHQKKQHELLASLAWEAVEKKDFPDFLRHYNQLQSWTSLDRYTPPEWLSEEEALHEFFLFHNSFGIIQLDPENKEQKDQEVTEHPSWQPKHDVTIVLDQVRSPYNFGSVLRIIDNFGLKGLVHNSSWLRMDHPQLTKAARGCEQWIPVEYVEDIPSWLKNQKRPVIGIENDRSAISLKEFDAPETCVIIVGSEVYGIASGLRDCCDQMVRIPMSGYKQSMNLNQALAVVTYKIVESI